MWLTLHAVTARAEVAEALVAVIHVVQGILALLVNALSTVLVTIRIFLMLKGEAIEIVKVDEVAIAVVQTTAMEDVLLGNIQLVLKRLSKGAADIAEIDVVNLRLPAKSKVPLPAKKPSESTHKLITT